MGRSRTKKPEPTTAEQEDAAAEAHYEALAEQQCEPSFNPIDFDPAVQKQAGEIVHGVAESTRIEPEPAPAGRTYASGFIANPSSSRRESHATTVGKRPLPSVLGIAAGDMKVQMIDKGDNSAGIGIRVVFPEGSKDRPTAEEKEIIRRHVKGEDGEQTGFNWNGQFGMWHKDIVRRGEHPKDVPATRAVAIRLDAESRVAKLAEALREHQVDPAGFAERIRQQREQAASGERIPD